MLTILTGGSSVTLIYMMRFQVTSGCFKFYMTGVRERPILMIETSLRSTANVINRAQLLKPDYAIKKN